MEGPTAPHQSLCAAKLLNDTVLPTFAVCENEWSRWPEGRTVSFDSSLTTCSAPAPRVCSATSSVASRLGPHPLQIENESFSSHMSENGSSSLVPTWRERDAGVVWYGPGSPLSGSVNRIRDIAPSLIKSTIGLQNVPSRIPPCSYDCVIAVKLSRRHPCKPHGSKAGSCSDTTPTIKFGISTHGLHE